MKKLRKIHIIIIGIVGCAMIAAGLFFFPIKKNMKALEDETTRYNTFAPTGTPQKVAMAKADFEKAVQEVADNQALLDHYMIAKMPNLNLGRREMGMVELWHEQSEVLGPLLMRWIKSTGVYPDPTFNLTIPAPPSNPNDPLLEASPITIALGKITVVGTFKDIMNHLRKWNQCKRLVLVDSPNLTGHSPNLVCDYTASVLIFPRTPAGKTVEIAGAAGAAAGARPGMPGGLPSYAPRPPGQ